MEEWTPIIGVRFHWSEGLILFKKTLFPDHRGVL
jgi:hypothetical protein